MGKVRYVGEPVVAVVAETRELARDASELVEVDYEPLPAVVDARKAQESEAPMLHDDAGGNLMWTGLYSWGDLDTAFALLERSLQKPAGITVHELRLDPVWDPLRGDPRLEQLLLKYGAQK